MKIHKNSQPTVHKEKGSVLIISLVLLTAITLISITSLQRTSLQTRIVANFQHSESGFHIANAELDEIFLTYRSDPVKAIDLSTAIDSHDITSSGDKSFKSMSTSVKSTYSIETENDPHSIEVYSKLIHTGELPFTSGYSFGGVTTYVFETQADAYTPNNGYLLSSQSQGLELIGPASI